MTNDNGNGNNREIVTVEQFAARYKVAVETVRRWYRRGVLPV